MDNFSSISRVRYSKLNKIVFIIKSMKKTIQKNTSINKKAAGLVQATIISLIILVVGAAVILIFLHYFPFTQIVDKEACHNSVILRSQKLGEMLVPLKCKTQYITIDTSDEEKIKRIIADAMYDCWWMLGEGRYDFFPEKESVNFGLHKLESSCVICSVIKFSDKVKKENLNINIVEYLNNHIIPGKNITYVQYFSNSNETIRPADLKLAPTISTSKDYAIVFMGVKSPELWEPVVKDLGILVGGAFLFGASSGAATGSLTKGIVGGFRGVGKLIQFLKPIKTISTQGIMITETGARIPLAETTMTVASKAGITALVALGITMIAQTGVTIWNQQIAATYCDGSKKGCFSLILTPLEASNITKYCTSIESIP